MAEPTEPKPESVAIEPYRLGDFATGGKIDFITRGNVSIPLSLELLQGIVPVKSGDRKPNVTELVMFANAVIEQKCNCYLNECWLVLIRGKYVPIIAAQKRIAKAQSVPSYDGYEWGWIDKDGNRCASGPEDKAVQADIIGVWNRIYFKDRKLPFYHEVFRSEYSHQKNDRPITMLLKTARDQTHKYAFANEMGNLCTENELYDERLPAPESDVLPREQRRSLAVPSSAVDATRKPVPEPKLVTFKCSSDDCIRTYQAAENCKNDRCECGKGILVADNSVTVAEPIPKGTKPDPTALKRHLDASGKAAAANARNNYIIPPKQETAVVDGDLVPDDVASTEMANSEKKRDLFAEAEVKKPDPDAEARAKEANEPQEKDDGLVTFHCNNIECGRTYRYGKEEGKGVQCECQKGTLVEVPAGAGIFTNDEKGRLKELYVEVNGMYVAQNGQDFIEFAAFVLCLDENAVAPSKLTEEQLKQIKAYIETSGVAIN